MHLDCKLLEKPMRRLGKGMKTDAALSPGMVHELRTSTRRIEAVLAAIGADDANGGRRLLKLVKPLRKKAGRVRDLDVFVELASTLDRGKIPESYVELLELLGVERARAAKALHGSVEEERDEVKPRLKRWKAKIEEGFGANGGGDGHRLEWEETAAAAALRVSSELMSWPVLTRANLHAFRLKVKELRYLLELSDETQEAFLTALGAVKDAIGEWHDWVELEGLAADRLGEGGNELQKQMREIAGERLKKAMRVAGRFRRRELPGWWAGFAAVA